MRKGKKSVVVFLLLIVTAIAMVMAAKEISLKISNSAITVGTILRIEVEGADYYGNSLVIKNEDSGKKYVTKPEPLVLFKPKYAGQYSVSLVEIDESVIQSLFFKVLEPNDENSTDDELNDGNSSKQVVKDSIKIERSDGRYQFADVKKIFYKNESRTVVNFSSGPIKEINFTGNVSLKNKTLFIERVTKQNMTPGSIGKFVDGFAVDPTQLSFTKATMTRIAEGKALYKCRDYNFSAQKCNGEFYFLQALTPGEEYTIDLSPSDPYWSETNSTLTCSCTDSGHGKTGGLICSAYCKINVGRPDDAFNGYIEKMHYSVTFTGTTDGSTFSNGAQSGIFDHDQTYSNSNEVTIGSSTYTATTTTTWRKNNLDNSGSLSFTKSDCSNWASGYCTYYIRVYAKVNWSAGSTKRPSIQMALNWANYTWNYTTAEVKNVTLHSPDNLAYIDKKGIRFSFTPYGGVNFENCSLYTNETSWSSKHIATSLTANVSAEIAENFTNDGQYRWNIVCYNILGERINATTDRKITIDTVNPTIYLTNPDAGATWSSSNTVQFDYNVSDTNTVSSCELIVDEVSKQTDTTITKNTLQSFSQYLGSGTYNWKVNCTDQAGNEATVTQRSLTVSVIPPLWNGKWYSTWTSNSKTMPVNISLSNQTDGTGNNVYGSIASTVTATIYTARTGYIGNNGGYIPASSTVNFRSYILLVSGNRLYSRWKLSKISGSSSSLICQDLTGMEMTSAAYTYGTCSPSSDIRILSTDLLQLTLIGYNDQPSLTRTFNHTIDHTNSYVDILSWHNIGYSSVTMENPTANQNLLQNENITIKCNASCTEGECINASIGVQYNTSSTSWTKIGASGNMIMNGDSNYQNVGNISNDASVVRYFNILGNTASSNNVRCVVRASYATDNSSAISVIVADDNPPIVNLTSPTDGQWLGYNTNVVLRFNATDASALGNCSLYIDGIYNTTKQAADLNNGGISNFTLNGISDGLHNWTVNCSDDSGREENSETWDFTIDTTAPWIDLNEPDDAAAQTSYTVYFNFTANDNLDSALDCSLKVDGTVKNATISATSGLPKRVRVSQLTIGWHHWNVTCTDSVSKSNSSVTRHFNITDNPPTVSLTSPGDNSWTNNHDVVLYYLPTDNDGFQNCSLFLNGNLNDSKGSSEINNGETNNFTLPGMADGAYDWTVNCTDTGNFSLKPAHNHFNVDTGLPWVDLSSPADEANLTSSTVNFIFTADDLLATTITCNISINGDVAKPDVNANIGSATTSQVTGITDGIKHWNVSCWDNALNSNSSSTRMLNMSMAPAVTQTAPAPNQNIGENFTFAFTISDNDGFSNCTVYIDGNPNATKQESELSNGVSNSINITDISEGNHNWSVLCYDNGTYKNDYQTADSAFIVDVTKPSIRLNFPKDQDSVNSSSINFNFTAMDNIASSLSCNFTVSGGRNVTGLTASDDEPYNYTLNDFLNGIYYWNATCQDSAGNANTSRTYTFNVTVPPAVNLTVPGYEPFWDKTGINAHFEYLPSSNGNLSNCSLLIDGIKNMTESNPLDNQNNTFETNLSEGYHTWNVICYDLIGLSGEGNDMRYYVDLHAPEITLAFPGDEQTVTSNYVNYNFTIIDAMAGNVTCNLTVNDGSGTYNEIEDFIVQNNTPYNFTVKYHDGNYEWNVSCSDPAGNHNLTLTNDYIIEAPPLVTLYTPNENTWSSDNDIFFTYYAYDPYLLRNCTLFFDGLQNYTIHDPGNGANRTINITDAFDGYHNWTVECLDADYNPTRPTAKNFYIDTKSPWITLNNPVFGENFSTTTVQLNLTPNDLLSPNVTCNVSVDGNVKANNVIINSSASYIASASSLTEGLHHWNATCTDIAGNSNISGTAEFSVFIPPKVSLVSPENNLISGNPNQTFYFNVSDDTGIFNCSVVLNGQEITTKNNSQIINNAENNLTASDLNGTYTWVIKCFDNTTLRLINESEGRNIYIDLVPPEPYIETNALTWFNTLNPGIDFNITDNYASTISYILYVDGRSNKSGTVSNGISTSANLVSLTDGLHEVILQGTDSVNNSKNSSAISIRVDTHAPWIILNNPVLGENFTATTVDLNFTPYDLLSPNMTCTVRVDGNIVDNNAVIANGTSHISSASSLTEGLHLWNATCTDVAGNSNISVNGEFNVYTPPEVSLISPENNQILGNPNQTFYFMANDSTGIFNCSLILNGQEITTKNNSQINNNAENNLTAVNLNGTYAWSVKCFDNTSFRLMNQTSNWNVYIDLVPPEPYIETNTLTWFNTVNPGIDFNITDNYASTISYILYVDSRSNKTGTVSNGISTSANLVSLTDGLHEVILEGTDSVNNTKNSSAISIRIDTHAPWITLNYPAFGENFTTTTVDLNFTPYDLLSPNMTCTVLVDGNVKANNVVINNGTSYNVSATSLTQGQHQWNATCTDVAGNTNTSDTGTFSIFLPPQVSLVSPENNHISGNQNQTFYFTVSDITGISNCSLILNGQETATKNNSQINNDAENNLTANNLNGTYTWAVKCFDNTTLKLMNQTSNWNLYIDLVPPEPYIETNTLTWFNTANPSIDFNITDNYASTIAYRLYVDGRSNKTGTASNGASTSANLVSLTDGTHSVVLEGTDSVNNSKNSSAISIRVDTHAPWIILNSPVLEENYTTRTVQLNFTPYDMLSPNMTCSVRVDGTLKANNVVITNGSGYEVSATSLTEGLHHWNATCTDVAGNANTSDTKEFNVLLPPEVSLVSPANNHISGNPNQTFYFNVSDVIGIFNCSLVLNGQESVTKNNSQIENNGQNNFTANDMNGTYTWSVKCFDNTTFLLINQTSDWNLYIDVDPPQPYIETNTLTWFNTVNPGIDFNITDNYATSIAYILYVDSRSNKSGTVSNGVSTSANLVSVTDGLHEVILHGTDSVNNSRNSSAISIRVDTHSPWITLNKPPQDNLTDSTTVVFNFTSYDAMSENLSCRLRIDGSVVGYQNATNGTIAGITYKVTPGDHYWNITCYDLAGNSNNSLTRNFSAPAPDLKVKSAWISFSDTPRENAWVDINATIINIGGADAENAKIQFYNGDPDSGGIKINGDIYVNISFGENASVGVPWKPGLGWYNIYLVADPPTLTNGSIEEINETNNKANISVQISGYHIIVGNISGDLWVANSLFNVSYLWSGAESNNSNIFAADSDSNIDFFSLKAIGKTISGGVSSNDFEQIDNELGTSSLADSINNTYTSGGSPKEMISLAVFGNAVEDIPVVESTNVSLFKTGILWDSGDGGSEYDASQDIVFVTKSSRASEGAYGTYDFEIKVPSKLREYISTTSNVAFYIELKT